MDKDGQKRMTSVMHDMLSFQIQGEEFNLTFLPVLTGMHDMMKVGIWTIGGNLGACTLGNVIVSHYGVVLLIIVKS